MKNRQTLAQYDARVRRRLFNFVTAVSLLLFLATATLGLRSYYVWDEYHVEVPGSPRAAGRRVHTSDYASTLPNRW